MTRIVSGEWRGHQLPKLQKGSVRPTTDRARTIMFDTLRHLQGLRVLDLYSGTGALGFEALSRGAASLISIDKDPKYIKAQQEWMVAKQRPFQGIIGAVERRVKQLEGLFDLILADPPYAEGLSSDLVEWVGSHLSDQGRFVFERPKKETQALASERLILEKEKVVADTRIQIYKAEAL